MTFRIVSIDAGRFRDLHGLNDAELAKAHARRVIATTKPGFPCRVSLVDAEVGETLLLVGYEHQPADTPYRSRHAIYVREGAVQCIPAIAEVPEMFRHRTISLRGFDAAHSMIEASLGSGHELERAIGQLFANPRVEYLHLHNAAPGCFAARAIRA